MRLTFSCLSSLRPELNRQLVPLRHPASLRRRVAPLAVLHSLDRTNALLALGDGGGEEGGGGGPDLATADGGRGACVAIAMSG